MFIFQINTELQNVNMLSIQRLVHTSDRTEFPTHRAALLDFRLSLIANALCRLGINGTLPLFLPIECSSCICHLIVQISCMRNMLCDVRRMSCDLGGYDPLFDIFAPADAAIAPPIAEVI